MRVLMLGLLLVATSCVERTVTAIDDPEVPPDTDDPQGGVKNPFAGLGNVEGRICGPNGASWVGGADVWIEQPDQIVRAMTDVEGHFVLLGVNPGIHTVRVQKGSFGLQFEVEVFEDRTTKLPEEECLEQGDLRFAVVTGEYDQIERILDRMSLEYDLVPGIATDAHVQFLKNGEDLAKYDILFLNCGMNRVWWDNVADRNIIAENIRTFVRNGGSVYTSDMTYAVLEEAYPDSIDFLGHDDELFHPNQLLGPVRFTASIVDDELERAMGSADVTLTYEGEGLYAAGDRVGTATPLITGTFPRYDRDTGQYYNHPGVLAAREDQGAGRIIFTSFHNEAQDPTDMDPLLEALVLTL